MHSGLMQDKDQTIAGADYIERKQNAARRRAEQEASEPHGERYYRERDHWHLVRAEVRSPDEAAAKLAVLIDERAKVLQKFRQHQAEERFGINRTNYRHHTFNWLRALREERRRLERLVIQPRLL